MLNKSTIGTPGALTEQIMGRVMEKIKTSKKSKPSGKLTRTLNKAVKECFVNFIEERMECEDLNILHRKEYERLYEKQERLFKCIAEKAGFKLIDDFNDAAISRHLIETETAYIQGVMDGIELCRNGKRPESK